MPGSLKEPGYIGVDVMASVSLCMIVKNEEVVLKRCIDSVRDAVDEVIIVDTGSQDNTRAIASELTPKVYDFEWIDDFAAARNYAFSLASCDYIMWLDADDVIDADERNKLRAFAKKLSADGPDVVMMKYCLSFDETGKCTMWNWRERLIKRSANLRWQGAVHECITPSGRIEYADISIRHMPGIKPTSWRNLMIYEGMRSRGETFSARDAYYYARELYYHALYAEAAYRFEEFISRGDGWIEDIYAACKLLGQCKANLGDSKGELNSYLCALEYGAPRADICCSIGLWYTSRTLWPAAEIWLKEALNCKQPEQSGFVNEYENEFLPCIWLCVCRDRQGDLAGAMEFHERAKKLRPYDPAVLANDEYFKKRESLLATDAKPE